MKSVLLTPMIALFAGAIASGAPPAADPPVPKSVFAKDNLVAWCIVPFDAKHRSPQQRAEMLARLGIKRVAYDWRQDHVPTFEEEIVQYKKHGLEYFAFWSWHPDMAPLIKKHGIHPQIWMTVPSPAAPTQEARVEAAAKAMLPMVETTRKLGCKLGLYNHGGWGGEPESMVAVAKWLRTNAKADHVGIVYNFHHGHGYIRDFAQALALMQPYLLCLNLDGMNDNAKPLILPLGKGQHELEMLKIIEKSGYGGPIGILDHRGDTDAEQSLRENLDGLKKMLGQMGDKAALATYGRP